MKRVAEIKFSQILSMATPIRLHLRSDLHLARKIWHLGMGLVIVMLYLAGVSRSAAVVILGSFLGFDLLMETMRLRVSAINDRILRLWGPIMRANELTRMSGIPYYLAATVLAIGIFPKPIAVLSILYLACGDPIASFFGVLYGQHSIRFSNGKSFVGTLAGILSCALVTFLFLNTLNDFPKSAIFTLTLVGGISGGLAELLPLEVDDNFSIPMVAGFLLWLAFILMGI